MLQEEYVEKYINNEAKVYGAENMTIAICKRQLDHENLVDV